MTKTEFVARLAARYSMPHQEAEKIINAFLDSVEDALAIDGNLKLRDFGIFEVVITKPLTFRNIATGELVTREGGKKIRFKASLNLKNSINGD